MILHCIHDPLRKDRYELLKKEIEEQGLEIELWSAVKKYPKARMNINEAHRNIVRYAKENNLEEIAICEDDVHFTAKGAWDYFLKNKPEDYHLYLSGISWGKILRNNTVVKFSGLMCYMVHKKYYDLFLSSNPNLDIDAAQTLRGIFKVCNPFIATQHETISDNTNRIHLNAKLYRNRVLYTGQTT